MTSSDPTVSGPPAVPADFLCFDLYTASRTVTSLYRRLLRGTGLTYPQYLVLVVLWRHGSVTVKQLGEALSLDYGTLSPLLQRMEQRGLVVRIRSTTDERSVYIALAEDGRAMQARTAHVRAAVVDASGLSLADIARLQQVLRTFTASVEAWTGPDDGVDGPPAP